MKATFFICGANNGKGQIDEVEQWGDLLRRMYAAGHQLGSHTWTHYDLSLLDPALREEQIIFNEMAFRNLFGWVPKYMRPPYKSCTRASGCMTTMHHWGYHIINFDVDTLDFNNDMEASKHIFEEALASSSRPHIVIAHDVNARLPTPWPSS